MTSRRLSKIAVLPHAAADHRFPQSFWGYGSYGQVSVPLQTFHFLQQVEEIELYYLIFMPERSSKTIRAAKT